MTPEAIHLDKPCEHVLRVTLNSNNKAGTLNFDTIAELHELWHELTEPNAAIRAIILTGSGSHFSSIDESCELPPDAERWLHEISECMHRCPIPIIGLINGNCLSPAFEWLLACDMLIAYRSAELGFGPTRTIKPSKPACCRLEKWVGIQRAKQLLLTRQPISTKDAHNWGLIQQLSTKKALAENGLNLAQQVIQHCPETLSHSKEALG